MRYLGEGWYGTRNKRPAGHSTSLVGNQPVQKVGSGYKFLRPNPSNSLTPSRFHFLKKGSASKKRKQR